MEETQVLPTNTSFTTYTTISPSSLVLISQEILFAIVCFVGLLGNTLVIYVVIRFSKMQTVTNMYIVNLAIADECFLIGIPFLIVTMVKTSWIFGEVMCKVSRENLVLLCISFSKKIRVGMAGNSFSCRPT